MAVRKNLQINAAKVKQRAMFLVEQMLYEERNWKHLFGRTTRENGEIVDGNPRDTIDTGALLNSLEVSIEGLVVTVSFDREDAEEIFAWRREFFGDVVEEFKRNLVKELAVYVVAGELEFVKQEALQKVSARRQKQIDKRFDGTGADLVLKGAISRYNRALREGGGKIRRRRR